MRGKGGKQWSGLHIAEKIGGAFYALSEQVKRFNDTLEKLSFEIKRFNDLYEGKPKPKAHVVSKGALRGVAEKAALRKPERTTVSQMNIPGTLYKSILAISQKKPEFTMNEVIDRAMKSSRGSFKKQSMNTALQGFKVGSKTANKQPERCRDLIKVVEGKKGLYRLNPDKMPSPAQIP